MESIVSPGTDRALAKRTFQMECLRAVPSGYMEACASSLFLLIALKGLGAGSTAKAIIAAGVSGGLLASPLLLRFAQRAKRPVTVIAAWIMSFGGIALVVGAAVGGVRAYAAATVLAMTSFNIVIPLLTTVYQRNYGPHERGRNVSLALMVRFSASAAVAWFVGKWLDHHLRSYRLVLVGAAAALFASALLVLRIESEPIPDDRRRRLSDSLGLLAHDRVLASTMASWMFVGFANLVTIPLRTEYLGNPKYGIDAKPSRVAFLIVAVPAIARVVMSPVFGLVFDRMSFFAIRIAVNLGFGLSIVAFFAGRSTAGLVFGSIAFGVSAAGGDILWNLWATKLAPPHQVADYMALHTFFTGLRGALAPFTAYWLVSHLSVAHVGAVAAVFVVVASVILIPDIRAERTNATAQPA